MLNHASTRRRACYSTCLEHADLFMVATAGAGQGSPVPRKPRGGPAAVRGRRCARRVGPRGPRHATGPLVQTTGVLTTTTLVYTYRAGITAGAGTRLVLYLLLMDKFGLHPFQTTCVVPFHKMESRYILSLPPRVEIG